MTYQELSEKMGDKNALLLKKSRAQVTAKKDGQGNIAIMLYWTAVLTFNSDETITLNSGGYKTHTTKKVMNKYLPYGFHVYQEAHVWYVYHYGKTYTFQDGMVLGVKPDYTYPQ